MILIIKKHIKKALNERLEGVGKGIFYICLSYNIYNSISAMELATRLRFRFRERILLVLEKVFYERILLRFRFRERILLLSNRIRVGRFRFRERILLTYFIAISL